MRLRMESWLRQKLGQIQVVSQSYQAARRIRLKLVRIEKRSLYKNIYYCCTQKTASQWLRAVFSDTIVFKYTGLKVLPYIQLGLKYASFQDPFPVGTIGTHLYISYPVYCTIEKPDPYKTFFVLRDPRDIITSWYFSARHSHVPIPPVPELRKDLQQINQDDGFKYIIDRLDDWGSFDTQRSWMGAEKENDAVRLFRYEELAHDYVFFLESLFAYLDIKIPEEEFATLCERHTFKKYSGWRDQGVEDHHSHYRKGVPGDWKNYFNKDVADHFRLKTGDLLEVIGYKEE
ncbi:MAG: sulfotransferase domain-containing protein [Deltaproteobacteria bacterium]|nr:sulfotransferase domain-containing protein [Deltaproteobacteria bacterium]